MILGCRERKHSRDELGRVRPIEQHDLGLVEVHLMTERRLYHVQGHHPIMWWAASQQTWNRRYVKPRTPSGMQRPLSPLSRALLRWRHARLRRLDNPSESRYDQDLRIDFPVVKATISVESVRSIQGWWFPRHDKVRSMYREREREKSTRQNKAEVVGGMRLLVQLVLRGDTLGRVLVRLARLLLWWLLSSVVGGAVGGGWMMTLRK